MFISNIMDFCFIIDFSLREIFSVVGAIITLFFLFYNRKLFKKDKEVDENLKGFFKITGRVFAVSVLVVFLAQVEEDSGWYLGDIVVVLHHVLAVCFGVTAIFLITSLFLVLAKEKGKGGNRWRKLDFSQE
ncbi:MAG: hypothetical protein U9Q73_02285 [Nanoarchaeota archaeon]|nr:hypothetical protein [Nanoarchaeota archaeon]